jgi:Flp pilus assembly protein TadD
MLCPPLREGVSVNEVFDMVACVDALKAALACVLQAVAMQPDMLEALTGLGLSCKELGSLKQAEEAFEAVLRLQPDNALALGNLAGLYFDQGKLSQVQPFIYLDHTAFPWV